MNMAITFRDATALIHESAITEDAEQEDLARERDAALAALPTPFLVPQDEE